MMKNDVLSISSSSECLIKNGIINDFDSLLIDFLSVPAFDMITYLCYSLTPSKMKMKIIEMLYEKNGFGKKFMFLNNDVAACYAVNALTGMVISIGFDNLTITPIYEGFKLVHAVRRYKLGGKQLSEYLSNKIDERINKKLDDEIIDNIKENVCYVSAGKDSSNDFKFVCEFGDTSNYDIVTNYEIFNSWHFYNDTYNHLLDTFPVEIVNEIYKYGDIYTNEATYVLPDNNRLFLGDLRVSTCDLLFNSYLGEEYSFSGLHNEIYDVACHCEIDIRKDFYENMILSGGSTCFKGIGKRMINELGPLLPRSYRIINVIDNSNRGDLAIIGSSIVSKLSSFNGYHITKNDYEDYGPTNICKRKCPY